MRFGDTLLQDVRLKLQAPIQIIKEGSLSIEDISEWQLALLFARLGSPNISAKPQIHSDRPTTYHSTYFDTLNQSYILHVSLITAHQQF